MGVNTAHIGLITVPRKKHTIILAGLNEAFTSGDMLSSELHTLDCATLAKGMGMQIAGLKAWEKSAAGTQIKAGFRVHVYNKVYTPPAMGAAWKGPLAADYLVYLGYHDLATGDYLEVGDGVTTDPDYAFASKVIARDSRQTFYSGDITNTLWANVEIRETKTFTSSSIIVEIDTLLV